MARKFTSWGSEFMAHHGKVIESIGVLLRGVGEVIPIVGGPVRVLGIFTTYCGSKGTEKAAETKEILSTLEVFLQDLEKTYEILQKYDDEDKKDSKLTLEVKVSLKSCLEWAELIEKKKPPADLAKTLKQRVESLKSAIARENLDQAIRVNQRAKIILKLQQLDRKKPWEYYEDGKYLISQKKWLDAKTNLLHYRKFVESKTPIMTEKDDNGIKPPEKDSHLKYLAYVQDQLAAQMKEEPDPILSVVSAPAIINQYRKLWDEWEATYMKRT